MTPTIFGPDYLKAALEADFVLRGIVAAVLVGEWETEQHYGAARVVIGLSKGSFDDPAGMRFGASGWIDIGGGQVARALLGRVQTFSIWVHAVAAADVPPDDKAVASREATAALLDQTGAALRRTRGGLPILPWPIEWLSESSGDFAYGTLCRFDAPIAVAVFDDPSDTFTADEAQGLAQVDADGLAPVPPESVT